MNNLQKTPARLDCPIVLSEEFLAVYNDNVCTALIKEKNVWKFLQSSKNIIYVDSDDENEINNAAPVTTSSEMKNVMRRSFAMQEKGGNRLVPGPDYMVDALKLSNQAPRVSGESLHTSVAWSCSDGTQHLFCWPILAVSTQ
ncbi:hypothetical protein TNCV_5057441 [Trichonephila clavipes]|nr:hypothetical protein TNCV_5057441 [Trichonephila clavipes]